MAAKSRQVCSQLPQSPRKESAGAIPSMGYNCMPKCRNVTVSRVHSEQVGLAQDRNMHLGQKAIVSRSHHGHNSASVRCKPIKSSMYKMREPRPPSQIAKVHENALKLVSAMPRSAETSGFDPAGRATALSTDRQNAGTTLFVDAAKVFTDVAPVLQKGQAGTVEYAEALRNLISTLVGTACWLKPPTESLVSGIWNVSNESCAARKASRSHLISRVRVLSIKVSMGVDIHPWRRDPNPMQLLQQIAFGMVAAADLNALPKCTRQVAVELLEDAFQSLSSPRSVGKYKSVLESWGIAVKPLQFGIMRILCVLYRALLFEDRAFNIRYLFRHAEAAGIMIMTTPEHYAGHSEHAWNSIQKITLGTMHVTSAMWEQAKQSAEVAVCASAKAQHDFEFAPAAYNLAFLLACGLPGHSFNYTAVKTLLEDVQHANDRLQEWGMRDHVLFDCNTKNWLVGLQKEWGKEWTKGDSRRAHVAAKDASNPSARYTLDQARHDRAKLSIGNVDNATFPGSLPPGSLPPGHLPVTDWRVWDQRIFGFYTWLEPPMQPEPQKCAMCTNLCRKVHRCDVFRCETCKLVAYCSSLCARAHMFDHYCDPAPKAWLSPPVPMVPAPSELGEEGFLGCIPWSLLKYFGAVLVFYALLYGWRAFDAFREEQNLERMAAVMILVEVGRDTIKERVQALVSNSISTVATGDVDSTITNVSTPQVTEF